MQVSIPITSLNPTTLETTATAGCEWRRGLSSYWHPAEALLVHHMVELAHGVDDIPCRQQKKVIPSNVTSLHSFERN